MQDVEQTLINAFPPILAETSEPQWDNEEDVTSQLTLLGLVGIDTVDEYVSG